MIRRILTLISIAALTACGGPSDDYSGSYVGGDQTALLQLNIVDGDSGQITGNIAISELDYGEGRVKLTTRPVTGVRNGAEFSLVAEGGGWGIKDAPLNLQADGNSLVLLVPGNGQTLELQPMGQDEYRERLTQFAQALNANDVGLLPDE